MEQSDFKKQRKYIILDTHAFTILELSIVIIIIGLITGGVFVGKNMVANAKLRSVAMEEDRLVKATKMFQDKYFALPGDMKNAQTVWGGGPAIGGCPWGARGGAQTCNGDGNAKVMADASGAPNNTRELFTFWQHQSIAGTLEESFSGISTIPSYGYNITAGINVPKSAWLKTAGWNVLYIGYKSGDTTYYDGSYGHVLMLGDAGFFNASNGVMTPDEQMRLDTKFDDSSAATGNIRAAKDLHMTTACITSNSYNIAVKTPDCAPLWITGF